jgi:hypothetical protein
MGFKKGAEEQAELKTLQRDKNDIEGLIKKK